MKPMLALLPAMGIILGFAIYKNCQMHAGIKAPTSATQTEKVTQNNDSPYEVTGSQREEIVEQFMQQAATNPTSNNNPAYETSVINLFTKELTKSPQNTVIRSNFVTFLLARGQYAKAKEHLSILLEQSADNPLYLKQMRQVNEHLK